MVIINWTYISLITSNFSACLSFIVIIRGLNFHMISQANLRVSKIFSIFCLSEWSFEVSYEYVKADIHKTNTAYIISFMELVNRPLPVFSCTQAIVNTSQPVASYAKAYDVLKISSVFWILNFYFSLTYKISSLNAPTTIDSRCKRKSYKKQFD